ncbi:hypothetical protein CONCODRAFT_14731 [Conidiobolus coronatus NRRL 28638]|uniref:Xylanolytic transcriptional activator regulatory domain-containing protein n=1 Tax=Conidiobolus coronatus (strain ATCC 28846 / CBS 209.66 / NRRL 28638) TaxID=796925 RepID=A0A137PHX6_CONC2|nr:hypothetical protein CONCODRAFT_14731 [Conidiobolus coronatus NRRL 28638]|eukprot:KXN74580.1 hypothetical protein CONCODRAFT_14731 [Conidiobolus coronatus NRRL 28638]
MTSHAPSLKLSETPSRSCDRCRKKKLRSAKPRAVRPGQAHLDKYLKVLHMVSASNPALVSPKPQLSIPHPSQPAITAQNHIKSRPAELILASRSHPQSQALVRIKSQMESPLLTPGFNFTRFKYLGIDNLKFIQLYRSIGAHSPVKFSLALSGIKLSQLARIKFDTSDSKIKVTIDKSPARLIEAIVTNDKSFRGHDFIEYQRYRLSYQYSVDAFFEKFSMLFPVISRKEFMESADIMSPPFILRRLVVWLIGNTCLLDYDTNYNTNLNLVISVYAPKAIRYQCVETIQSYALISYAWSSFNEDYNHWFYIGHAHRIAVMLGYHLKPPGPIKMLDYIERECLWMFVLYLEHRSMVQMGKSVHTTEWVSTLYKFRHNIEFSEHPEGEELEILIKLCSYFQILFRLNVACYFLAPSIYYTLNPKLMTPSLKATMQSEFRIMFRNSRCQINNHTSKIPKTHPARQLHVLYSLLAFHLYASGLLFMSNAFYSPIKRFQIDELNQLINISHLLLNVWSYIDDSFMASERMYIYHLLAMFYFRLLYHDREERNSKINSLPIQSNLNQIHEGTIRITKRFPGLDEYLIFFYKYAEVYNIELNSMC